jgi:hypothetical protein
METTMYRLPFAIYQLLTVLSNHSYSDEQIEQNADVIKHTLQQDIGSHAVMVTKDDHDEVYKEFPARIAKENQGVTYTYILDLPDGLDPFKMVIQVWVCSLAESWSLVVNFTDKDNPGQLQGASTKTLRLSLPVVDKSGKSFQQTFETFFNEEIQKLHNYVKAESCLGKDYLDRCAVVQTKFIEFLSEAKKAQLKVMVDTADGFDFLLAPEQLVPNGAHSVSQSAQVYTSTYRLTKLDDRGFIRVFSSNEYPFFVKRKE